jgi:hypothetical protein
LSKHPKAKASDWQAHFLTLKEINVMKRTYFTAIADGQAFAA